MTKGYKKITVLLVENGYLKRTRLVDFGSFLGQEISGDKWRAWAKGKPLLLKSRFGSRYTYIVTPEVGWTLDGDSIVSILTKGKQSVAPKFSGAPTYKVLSNGNGSKAVQPPKLTGVMTNEDVSKLIDEKLHNGFKKELLDEIKQLIAPKVEPPIATTNDTPGQSVSPQALGEAKPPPEPIPIIGPPIPVAQSTTATTEVKESK
jgi:hypothetical protein